MTIPRFEPMLATPWRSPFTDPGWLFEVKWDGVRAILTVDGGSVSVRSRRGNDITTGYPELSGFHPSRPCVLDGEIVAFDAAGRPSFGALQQRMNLSGGVRAIEAARTTPVTYVVFDLLFDGEDLTGRPIETRLERMSSLTRLGAQCKDCLNRQSRATISDACEIDFDFEWEFAKDCEIACRSLFTTF